MARKYRIAIDKGICQGHSVCVAQAPEIFRTVDNDGPYPMVDLITDTPPEELLARAEAAEELCPNGVIRIIYED